MEPSFRVKIKIPEGIKSAAPSSQILEVLEEFAKEHDQEQFHVSRLVDGVPEGVEEGAIDPETHVAFVRNIEFNLHEKVYNNPLYFDELTLLVQEFTSQPDNDILGYTIRHPKGFTFYMMPDPGTPAAEDRTKFTDALTKLNTQLQVKIKMFTDIEEDGTDMVTFQQGTRMLYVYDRDSQSSVAPTKAS
jgi:hypothetical protein